MSEHLIRLLWRFVEGVRMWEEAYVHVQGRSQQRGLQEKALSHFVRMFLNNIEVLPRFLSLLLLPYRKSINALSDLRWESSGESIACWVCSLLS